MSPIRHLAVALLAGALGLVVAAPAPAVTPNGRLQIIHLDVGQGDGAVLISPLGEVVMFDDGVSGNPTPANGVPVPAQLQALGVTHVKYHFASHYHADHIGLFATLFGGVNPAVALDYGWDRGGSYASSYYTSYDTTLARGNRRRTLVKGQVITLDSLSAHPVTITCVDLAGAGVSTTDENSLSVQLRVSYGEFDESFGGDTPGQTSGNYANIETPESSEIGPIEVYKVHHHGSATSSWTTWLNAAHPKIAVVSEGNGNPYGHPTASAMNRIHAAGAHVYWTERGATSGSNVAAPIPGWDTVANGQIAISATWEPGGVDTVRGNGFADTFTNSGAQIQTWTIAASAGAGGTIGPTGSVVVAQGANQSFTIGSAAGYHAVDVTVDGASAGTVTSYTFTNVTANHTISASFAINTYTIVASAGSGGSMTPSGSILVNSGASQGFTINPTAGNHVANVTVDAAPVGAVTSYTFTNVTANHTIGATFAINTYTLAASAGPGGDISPAGSIVVSYGGSQSFTVNATAGYHGADVTVDGVSVGVVASYAFTNVAANHTISASFAIDTYTISASAGPGGDIAPAGSVIVNSGASQGFTITPAAGGHVADVTVDGTSVGAVTSYTFASVSADHTIGASFAGDVYSLTIAIVGQGTVQKAPDQPTYPYGSALQLDATPAAGWAFSQWTGDTTAATASLPLTMHQDLNLTAVFVDATAPTVQVMTPNGGESLQGGDPYEITWSAGDNVAVDSVDVEVSLAGSQGPWVMVGHGLPNSGSIQWPVPDQASDSALVRVTAFDSGSNAGSDLSDAAFSIVPTTLSVGGRAAVLALGRPFPNPTYGDATLSFSIPATGHVRLEILDLAGRRVGEKSGIFPAGTHAWRWSGRDARSGRPPAGLYFVRLVTPWGTRTGQFVLLR